jgi:mRNA-degrading endonuclease RelE of RelBE toxin-antitoxin system
VRIRWAPDAAALAHRYMHDQDGMRVIVAAVDALANDPHPAAGFHRGRYHRLRVGEYRILYVIDDDLITIERVDRVIRSPARPAAQQERTAPQARLSHREAFRP